MMTKGILTQLEVKPGNETAVERILIEAISSVQEESATMTWLAFRLGSSTFGILEVFPGEEELPGFLSDKLLTHLEKANEFLTRPSITEKVDVLAAMLPQKGKDTRAKVGQFVRYQAKPGNETKVEHVIKASLPIIEQEPGTVGWFGLRLKPSIFGSLDAFVDEEARLAHLSAGMARVREGALDLIIEQTLAIEKIDVVASRLSLGNA